MITKQNILTLLTICFFIGCADQNATLDNGLYAKIETSKGSIILKLAIDKAPITVANFVSLSEGNNPRVSKEFKSKMFYNGLKFHRVINDLHPGGDPLEMERRTRL